MNTNVVHTLTIRGKTEGVAEATSAMKGLASATDAVTKSAVGGASSTEAQEKRQLSLADASRKAAADMQNVARMQDNYSQNMRQAAVANDNLNTVFGTFSGQLTTVSRQGRELTDVFLRPMKNVVMDNVIAWGLWRAGLISTLPEVAKFSGSLLTNNIQIERLGLKGGQITGMLKKMGDDFVQIQPPMKQSITLAGQFSAVTGTLANSFGSLAPQVAQASAAMQIMSAGGIIGAIVVGLTAAAAAGKKFADSIITTGENASFANINLAEYQRLQKVLGNSGGLSADAFASGTAAIAKNLFDASRESNTLEKLLKANNVEFEKGGKTTLGTVDAIKVMANLIKNATDGAQQLRIASAFGVSKEWVRAVEDGGDAIQNLINKMPKAGAAIDTEMIEKAKKFQTQWNTTLSEMLTAVQAWAFDAGKFLNLTIKINKITTRDEQDFADIARLGTLMLDSSSWQGKNNKEMDAIVERLKNSTISAFRQMGEAASEQWELMFGDKDGKLKAAVDARIADIKRIADAAESVRNQQVYLSPAADQGLRNLPAAGDKSTLDPPKIDATSNALDRQADSIKKRTATMIADTAAVGMGVAAQEQYRVKAQLLEAQVRADIETVKLSTLSKAEQARAIEKIGEDAGKAAHGLALMRAQNQADFTTKTQFFSPEDLAVAQAMNQIWGDEWPKHTQDNLALQIKFNSLITQARDLLAAPISAFVKDLASGVSFMDAIVKAAGTLGSTLIDLGVKRSLDQLFQSFGGDALGFATGATSAAAILTPAIIAAFTQGASAAAAITRGASVPGMPLNITPGADGAGLGGMSSMLGPIALVAGIGLSLFQADQQAKKAEEERIEKAKKAWEDSKSAAETWMTVMKGGSVGTLGPSIEQQLSQYKQFANLAHEAGDNASVRQMQDSFNEFIVRTLSEFRDQWFITVAGLEQGIGPDSPFQKGAGEMQTLGLDMLGMIEDAREAFGGFEPVIERTRQAAISYMLAQLGTVKPLSEVQEQLLTLQGRASTMQAALVKLGETAESAAAKISEGLTAAIAQMATDLRTQLEHDINEATGGGWLNSIIDLSAEFQQVSADARALGLDAGLVSLWLQSMAQEIVNSEQLVGAQFDAVLRNFPELAGQIHEFVDVLVRSAADIAAAQQNYQDQLFTLLQDQDTLEGQLAVFNLQAQREREAEVLAGGQAMADLEALQMAQRLDIMQDWNDRMLEEQQQAADEALSFWNGFAKQISDYTSNFYATPQGGLSPQAQLDAALSQFTSQLSLAQGGDRDALSSITGVHSTLVDAVRGFYASSAPGQSIIDSSLAQVGALPDQVRPEDLIIKAIEDTTSAIDDINSAIVAAVAANSPAAFALAIAGNFSTLDTSLDGLIDFDEMVTALGKNFAADGTFRKLFDRIAGADGLISKAEASRVALADAGGIKPILAAAIISGGVFAEISNNTGNTATNASDTEAGVNTLIGQMGPAGAASYIAIIRGQLGNPGGDSYPAIIRAQLGGTGADSYPAKTWANSIYSGVTIAEASWAMRKMMTHQNFAWGFGASPGTSLSSYHTGGLVGANDNEVSAKLLRNEYVLQPSAVASIGVPALNYANTTGRLPSFGGSDNSAVISELRGIAARLERVERAANRTAGNVQAGAAEVVAGTRAVMAPLTRKARLDAARVAA